MDRVWLFSFANGVMKPATRNWECTESAIPMKTLNEDAIECVILIKKT
jgi:hypothetical protein